MDHPLRILLGAAVLLSACCLDIACQNACRDPKLERDMAARDRIKKLMALQNDYYLRHYRYAGTFRDLIPTDYDLTITGSQAYGGGYVFVLSTTSDGYVLRARPERDAGYRSFYADQTGLMTFTTQGRP